MGKKRTNFVLREPVAEGQRQVFRLACGHEDLARADSDPHFLAREVGCQRCGAKRVGEFSDAGLLEYGKKCLKFAGQGIPYWERQLEVARMEWRRRAAGGN